MQPRASEDEATSCCLSRTLTDRQCSEAVLLTCQQQTWQAAILPCSWPEFDAAASFGTVLLTFVNSG